LVCETMSVISILQLEWVEHFVGISDEERVPPLVT
jgi:hypothetical protein